MSEPCLGPAEPRERLESLVPLAAELLRCDGRHFTMAQLRRPDGFWELSTSTARAAGTPSYDRDGLYEQGPEMPA